MALSLQNRTVLVIGRGSGIARAITLASRKEGARVVVAGRDRATLGAAYDDPGIVAETVDLNDDTTIATLAERLGQVDHVVSTASARARGILADLDREALRRSFDTKVIGPVMLAKHFAPRIADGGSFVIFSGVAAFKPVVGYLGVAITNGAVDFLARSLALELGPIRVNAISPGVIDTGIWDSLGEEGKRAYFDNLRARNPARRIGTVQDIADAVLYAMTSPFLTGVTLRVDGGEPLT
ncbi:NAD(P)-dependent dehydrogenase, short-chain alcohol dehydrogenase family [Streptosporangium subroseum]|uniref:NAD(P)-dependent dehydrogenase, short-chain alcohol dehydrogenase family n=1 Tax=Streptosporangium subroseum TaxID=106412 RepID=A0A239D0V2_9ACTN|nr:SDR family oxidoreductase [Streptosporangium subroseum]SNS25501.1 NAD(P)-dependent dehydrogenase, short-chain alcohol dehydrogenase family [Streptosporangium subroseum]